MQRALSTLLGALASGGPSYVPAAEEAVRVAEVRGGWPRGVLPAECYFNLLSVAHEAGDKAAADRISDLIRCWWAQEQKARRPRFGPHQAWEAGTGNTSNSNSTDHCVVMTWTENAD